MFTKFDFFVALRYLKSKRNEKFISITAYFSFIGIMLGVATLIIVMSVMNGFREELVNKILGINSHITIYPKNDTKYSYNEIIHDVKNFENVKTITPIIESQVMVLSESKTTGAMVRAIKLDNLKEKKVVYDNIFLGNNKINNFDENGLLLGKYLLQALDVKIGDSIKIVSPEVNITLIGTIPRIKTYKVIGTFESGIYDYDNNMIFMPFEAGQLHFRYQNAISAIELEIKDQNKIFQTKKEISDYLNNRNYEYFLVDWKDANSSFISALNVERNVMFIILTLIILVAVFNIISSLIMLVQDKSKQIALLKTIGVSNSGIVRIFLICGTFIGFIGTLFGTILGVVFATNIENIRNIMQKCFNADLFNPTIYFLNELPSKVFVGDVILIATMSLILSFLATIYPAFRASKTNPVDVLRYE